MSELELDTTMLSPFGPRILCVKLPDNITPTISDRDFTIATIAVPAGLSDETDEEETEESVTEDSSNTQENEE